MTEEPKDPKAAGDKPPSSVEGEPLKGEVSRTDSPGAGASAAQSPDAATAPKGASAAPSAPAASTNGADSVAAPGAPKAAVPPAAAKPAPAKPAAPPAAKPPAAGAAKPAAHDTKPAPPSGPADPPPPAGAQIPSFITALQAAVPGGVEHVSFYVGDWTVIVPAARLLDVGRFLREAPEASFDFCSDVTASDWPPRPQRFDVVYCLYSTTRRHRVRMKVRAAESEPVPSVSGNLAVGQLARARGVRPVRRELHWSPESQADSDAGRLAGTSPAEGLSARRSRRAVDGKPARLVEAEAGSRRG